MSAPAFTVGDRVRVTDPTLWCLGFPGVVVTVDAGLGVLRYGVRPDPTAARAACLWFLEGQIGKTDVDQ